MDARTVLALWADDLDLDLTHGNAAELFDLFKKHGHQIIHCDENHGPTLERAAETVEKANYPCAGDARRISTAIRAMGEKK